MLYYQLKYTHSKDNKAMENEIKEQRLPYTRAVFILGFVSLTIGLALFGLVGIVGIILARKGMKAFDKNPELYSIKSYNTLTRGLYMNAVGALALIPTIIVVILIIAGVID